MSALGMASGAAAGVASAPAGRAFAKNPLSEYENDVIRTGEALVRAYGTGGALRNAGAKARSKKTFSPGFWRDVVACLRAFHPPKRPPRRRTCPGPLFDFGITSRIAGFRRNAPTIGKLTPLLEYGSTRRPMTTSKLAAIRKLIQAFERGKIPKWTRTRARVLERGRLHRYVSSTSAHEKVLEIADDLLEGGGVEAIRNRTGTTVALYVNVGDPYAATLVYDGRFKVMGWGDWVEAYEKRHARLPNPRLTKGRANPRREVEWTRGIGVSAEGAASAARSAGFRQVRSSVGWLPLQEWLKPRRGSKALYAFRGPHIEEGVGEHAAGLWPLRNPHRTPWGEGPEGKAEFARIYFLAVEGRAREAVRAAMKAGYPDSVVTHIAKLGAKAKGEKIDAFIRRGFRPPEGLYGANPRAEHRRTVWTPWGEGPFTVQVVLDDRRQRGDRFWYRTEVRDPSGWKSRHVIGSEASPRRAFDDPGLVTEIARTAVTFHLQGRQARQNPDPELRLAWHVTCQQGCTYDEEVRGTFATPPMPPIVCGACGWGLRRADVQLVYLTPEGEVVRP